MNFIYLVIFFAFVFSFSLLSERKFEENLIVCTNIVVFFLYFLGLYLSFKWIWLFLALVSLGVVGREIIVYKKPVGGILEKIIANNISVGIVIFFVVCLMLYLCNIDRFGTIWDEWDHWMYYVKSMYISGRIAWAAQDYPPSIMLVEWLGMKFYGNWNEGILYTSFYCYMCAIILPFCKRATKREILFWPIVLILYVSIINVSLYAMLDTSPIIGVLSGYVMWAIWDNEKVDWFYYLRISVTLFIIILAKGLMIVIVFLLAGLLIATVIFKNRREKINCAISLIPPIAGYLLWKLYINMNKFDSRFTKGSTYVMKQFLKGEYRLPDLFPEFRESFITVFLWRPISNFSYLQSEKAVVPISTLAFLLIMICALVIWNIKDKNNIKKQIFTVFIVIIFLTYIFVFLVAMVTLFAAELTSYVRVPYLASLYSRYTAPSFVGIWTFFGYLIFSSELWAKNKATILFSLFLFINWNSVEWLTPINNEYQGRISDNKSCIPIEEKTIMNKLYEAGGPTRILYYYDEEKTKTINSINYRYYALPHSVNFYSGDIDELKYTVGFYGSEYIYFNFEEPLLYENGLYRIVKNDIGELSFFKINK